MTVKRDTAEERKALPLATGVLDYFPDALLAVAEVSRVGNEQHHPGAPLHWDKSKSTDEADALLRHLVDRGKLDVDGMRHSAKVAWRALALLQRELDEEPSAEHDGYDFEEPVSEPFRGDERFHDMGAGYEKAFRLYGLSLKELRERIAFYDMMRPKSDPRSVLTDPDEHVVKVEDLDKLADQVADLVLQKQADAALSQDRERVLGQLRMMMAQLGMPDVIDPKQGESGA